MDWFNIRMLDREKHDGALLLVRRITRNQLHYMNVALYVDGNFHLPFDSDADDEGSPILSDDETPTDYVLIDTIYDGETK